MMAILISNATMGVYTFDRAGIYTSNCHSSRSSFCESWGSWRPIFGIPFNIKKVKQVEFYSCGENNALAMAESNKQLIGGGIIDKDFEFKSSFDEYLKAMESAIADRELKHSLTSKHCRQNNVGDNCKGNVKVERLGGPEHEGKKHDVNEQNVSFQSFGLEMKHYSYKKYSSNNSPGKIDRVNVKFGRFEDYQHGGKKQNFINQNNSFQNTDTESTINSLGREGIKKGRKQNFSQGYRNTMFDEYASSSVSCDLYKLERNASMKVNSKFIADSGNESHLGHQSDSIVQQKDSNLGMRIDFGMEHVHERSHIQNKKISPKNRIGTLKGGNSIYTSLCRVPFNNFDVSGSFLNKPRVLHREVDEKVKKLAMCLNGSSVNMPEWMFSKIMRSANIIFTDHSILSIIQQLGKLGNWIRVLQLVEWLQSCEKFKSYRTRYVYTAALNALGRAKRPVESLNVFYAMQHQIISYPDLVTYRCIAVTLGQAGFLKELFDVIDFMRSPPPMKIKKGVHDKWDPRLEPDIVIYNAVLNACVQRKQWEGAFWVLQQIKQQGLKPSGTTYGLFMEALFVCGKYNLVHELFRKLEKSSILNTLTYNVLVNCFWAEGRTSEAVSAVEDMERHGIVGSAALYYDLACCLCSAGRCQEAIIQVEKICRIARRNRPLVVIYTGLIQACLDSGNIHNGVYIFNEMKRFCRPNLVTCNIMMKAFVEHGMFGDAKKLFKRMLGGNNGMCGASDHWIRVLPDMYTFNTLLDAFAAERNWDDFEYVYEHMLGGPNRFNSRRHLRLIFDASRAGKTELLDKTWNNLARENRVMPVSLIKERFCVKLMRGDYSAAICCITSQREQLQGFSMTSWLNLLNQNVDRFGVDALSGLIDRLNIIVAGENLPNQVLQNLLSACNELYGKLKLQD